MCGINLFFHLDGSPAKREIIEKMNRVLFHRGPDDSDAYIHNAIGMGHTRLSIVDIKGGAQPMHSSDGRYTIVFNGEIYNYIALRKSLKSKGRQFNTQSDTEVILEAYRVFGRDCVNQLQGMFSFIIYDKHKQFIFAARDRLGIKPFYYFNDGKRLIISSEMKSLLSTGYIDIKLNKASIANHFRFQFSVSPHTVFEQINELPPGYFMEAGIDDNFRIQQYWDLEFPEENEYETDDENFWQSEFESALHEAASSHLIGEVPIGTYLSGGLDSSTTTFLMKEHYPKSIQSFSIHCTNPNSDESYAYRPVVDHFGIGNSELTLDDDRDEGYFGLLKNCLYHLEQPQRLAVDIPHFLLSDHVKNQDYSVVYTGDGADEILAGYDCYRQDSMRVNGNLQGSEEGREGLYFSEYTQYFSDDYMELLLRLHHPDAQQQTINQFGCYPAWNDFWHILDKQKSDIFAADHSSAIEAQLTPLIDQWRPALENRHSVNQSLYIETKTRLPNWILWKSDRLSMAHSVEARVPFLHHPLVELSARVPPWLKLNDMDEKHILKNIMRPHLPEIPGDYKKRGFYTPIREWFFSEQHRPMLEQYLSPAKLEESNIFNPNTVKTQLDTLMNLPLPNDFNSYYQSLQLEWSLMLVLSTQMLHELFVIKDAPCFLDT